MTSGRTSSNAARRRLLTMGAAAAGVAACGDGRSPRQVAPNGAAASAAPTAVRSYETKFSVNQSPISENGSWEHTGLDWTYVQVARGRAHGTQTGYGGYDDSYAYLSGFPPNQLASAVLFVSPDLSPVNREVELLLRWSDEAHRAMGYECNLNYAGAHAQIVRWNGKKGDYTVLANARRPPRVATGDVMRATILGDSIKVYLNNHLIVQAHDSTYPTGNPGIGFFIRAGASNAEFGFTSFAARGL